MIEALQPNPEDSDEVTLFKRYELRISEPTQEYNAELQVLREEKNPSPLIDLLRRDEGALARYVDTRFSRATEAEISDLASYILELSALPRTESGHRDKRWAPVWYRAQSSTHVLAAVLGDPQLNEQIAAGNQELYDLFRVLRQSRIEPEVAERFYQLSLASVRAHEDPNNSKLVHRILDALYSASNIEQVLADLAGLPDEIRREVATSIEGPFVQAYLFDRGSETEMLPVFQAILEQAGRHIPSLVRKEVQRRANEMPSPLHNPFFHRMRGREQRAVMSMWAAQRQLAEGQLQVDPWELELMGASPEEIFGMRRCD